MSVRKSQLRKDHPFLIEMSELEQVLGYAEFYSFIPETIRIIQM